MRTGEDESNKIAGINANIIYIQRDIQEIKNALKDGYATKDSLSEIAREAEKRLMFLENKSNLWRFLSPTFAAIIGSTITFFIIQYFINLKD